MTQTSNDFSALIARLEALTGPDRETDALIEIEARRLSAYAVGLNDQQRARWLVVGFKGEVEDGSVRYHSPEYTASIDAAVALVERLLPGQCIRLDIGDDGQHSAFVFGSVRESGASATSTPAIALLIAALKFMSAVAKAEGSRP